MQKNTYNPLILTKLTKLQENRVEANLDLRPIPNFNDTYFLSKEGRVYRRRVKVQGYGQTATRFIEYKELQPRRGWNNAPSVSLCKDGKVQWSGSIASLTKLVFGKQSQY